MRTSLRRHRFLLARRGLQVGVLVLFALAAQADLSVLSGSLSASWVFDTVPLADPLALLELLAAGARPPESLVLGAGLVLAFYGVVGGRAFCGWVCPVNVLDDAAAWLARRLHLQPMLRLPRSTRFWMLGMTLLLSAGLGVGAFEWVSPVGLIVRAATFGLFGGAWVIFALFLFDLFVLPQGFCGHLCPLGAFWTVAGRSARLRVRLDAARCDHCMDCQAVCPERQVLRPVLSGTASARVDSGACTRCGRCVEVCPTDALSFALALGAEPRHRKEVEP